MNSVIDEFHKLYYQTPNTWPGNTWLGRPIEQSPFDIYLYQELVHEVRPASIIQTGVKRGGSLLMFASYLDLIGAPADARVVGVDIDLIPALGLKHPRIRLVEGSSIDPRTLAILDGLHLPPGMVVLDSDHSYGHVLAELRAYWPRVAEGQYLVCEDTNLGHPVPGWKSGPAEALETFLAERTEFEPSDRWKRNLISFHPGGWLRRVPGND